MKITDNVAEIALIGRQTSDPLWVSISRLRYCPEEIITTDATELVNEEAYTNGEPMETNAEPVIKSNEEPMVEVNEEKALDANKQLNNGMGEE